MKFHVDDGVCISLNFVRCFEFVLFLNFVSSIHFFFLKTICARVLCFGIFHV